MGVADWVWWQWASAASVVGIIWGAGALGIGIVFGRMVRLRDGEEGLE